MHSRKTVSLHIQKSSATLFLKDFLIEEATYKLKKIPEIENKLNRDDLINKTGNQKKDKTYDFLEEKFKQIIYHCMIHLKYK